MNLFLSSLIILQLLTTHAHAARQATPDEESYASSPASDETEEEAPRPARRIGRKPKKQVEQYYDEEDDEEEAQAPRRRNGRIGREQREKQVDLSILTQDELDIYRKGPIDQSTHVLGGLLGTFIGFGSGHIMYGMYGQRGWIYTAGEVGSLTLMIIGASRYNNNCTVYYYGQNDCRDSSAGKTELVVGLTGWFLFRIAEIIDVWTAPSSRNYEYGRIRGKLLENAYAPRWSIAPVAYSPKNARSVMPGLQFNLEF